MDPAQAPDRNPLVDGRVVHPAAYRRRRALNWFPLGLAYALLYMGRYNLTVAQGELGALMPKESFGDIFGVGTVIYGCAFVLNGPLTDRIGGRLAMLASVFGAAIANLAMGFFLRADLLAHTAGPVTAESVARVKALLTVLYGVNMYFQSFGAVAIVKVNSAWFHVRERGGFSGIFGVMISLGIYLAYDVNGRALKFLKEGTPVSQPTPTWIVFFLPAAALLAIGIVESILLRDRPSQAGHSDIETGAVRHEGEESFTSLQVLRRILTHPVILTVAAIEFCTGVLRQGVLQWFPIYSNEQLKKGLGDAAAGWTFTHDHWGLINCIAGIIGGNVAGWVSDRLFGSRRAPAAACLYGLLTLSLVFMSFTLDRAWILCALGFLLSLSVIGTHGLLSGTATMDFGGAKGTATAVGVIDGFVYLGTGLQAFSLGRITEMKDGWSYWPLFLLPFGVLGLLLLSRIWHAIPQGRRAAH